VEVGVEDRAGEGLTLRACCELLEGCIDVRTLNVATDRVNGPVLGGELVSAEVVFRYHSDIRSAVTGGLDHVVEIVVEENPPHKVRIGEKA